MARAGSGSVQRRAVRTRGQIVRGREAGAAALAPFESWSRAMACALGAARYDLLRRRAAARPTQRSEGQRGDASWPSLSRRQATVRAKHDSVLWTGARSERRTRAPFAPSRRRVLRLDPPALPHLQHPSQLTRHWISGSSISYRSCSRYSYASGLSVVLVRI
ncbi:unnamed protein product [Urochloa humidicola]